MDIEVAEERNDEVLVLSPVGRLDSGNVRSFESVVMDHVSSGERRVVVDFSRLDFVSSAGMRVLLIAANALKATVWPGKKDGGQPPLPWLLESCQVHSSHEGKMTTVQKEKMARRKLSLLRLAQELGKRVAAQGNPGELDGRVGSCFGNRRTRERVRIYRQSLALTVWTLCCPLRRGA